MHSELCIEVSKGKETVGIVESALILPVAAFHLAVVARRIWLDQFVADPQFGSRSFKKTAEEKVLCSSKAAR